MAFKTWSVGDVLTAADVNTYLGKQSVIVCTSGTRPSAPVEGMMIYETDTDVIRVYSGSGWLRFAVDVETHQSSQVIESTAITSITSTTYAAGTPVCGGTFVAPPSGAVFVTVGGTIEQTVNGNSTRLGWEIRTGGTIGTGTIVWAASSVRCIAAGQAVNTSGPAQNSASFRYLADTLTAGSTYNVQTMHQVTGGTGNVTFRVVAVEPVL